MNKCLIFPPRWSAAHPYLSLPCLTAYLEEKGIHVDQYDLNLEEFSYFLSKTLLENSLEKILKKDISEDYKEIYIMIHNYICKNISKLNYNIRDLDSFVDFNNYKTMRILLEEIHSFISNAYENFETKIDEIKFSEAVSMENVKVIINDKENNPYIEFARIIIERENLLKYDFIGISMVLPDQIIPALSLCNELKKQKSNIHICIGGSAFSKIYYKIDKIKGLFDYIDSILLFEGEETLTQLIISLETNTISLGNIPNLIYKEENDIKFNSIKKVNADVERLPIPIFKTEKLLNYLSPVTIFPYFISRSCYWGKCSFCDSDFGHDGKFRIKSVEKVVKDIIALQNNYGAKYIYFIDEAIPAKYLNRLCDVLIEKNVDITWFTCVKASCQFDEELCDKMQKSGCVLVFMGLESCSEKVLNDMNKGITLEDIKISTENFSSSGIWVHGFFINNFPTEESCDKLETIFAIFKGNIHSVGLAEFVLTKNSKIMINNLDFKLKNLKETNDFSSMVKFEIDGKKGNNSFIEIANLYSKRIYNRFYPNQVFFREHLPIFVKYYDLVNNQAYLKGLIQDDFLFNKNNLLYKEVGNKTLIYNLKSKGAFVCEYKLKNILNKLEGLNSILQVRNLIMETGENYQEIEGVLNVIFDCEV